MRREQNNEKRNTDLTIINRVAIICIAAYLLLAVLFPILAGEQLYEKESKGNMSMPVAQNGTLELCTGVSIDQHFTTNIQNIHSVSIQWGTYYRQNTGIAVMELYNLESGQLVLSESFDMAEIQEAGITTMTTEEPLNLKEIPLMLHVYSVNGKPGMSASPLMNESTIQNTQLYFSNTEKNQSESIPGTLCFSVEGTDKVWFGQHYWKLVVAGFLVLLIDLLCCYKKYSKGQNSYQINAVLAVKKYRFLIRQLVSRDFKTKYKRSVLGMFWSFLNPLLMMSVQYFIFSTIFQSDIPNYAAYLLIGIISFNFFSEACNLSLYAVLGNASLITKVYMPKYIYPLTRVMSSVVNLMISLIPMILVCIVTGVQFEKSALLALFFLVCLILFTLGVCLLLSTAMVFFRDTQFLWGVISMVWMYATAIFFPESIVPSNFRFVLDFNPLYHYIKSMRICILNGISPEPAMYGGCFLIAVVTLVIGAMIFKKSQDKFILYL